jgi:hypothetical protein
MDAVADAVAGDDDDIAADAVYTVDESRGAGIIDDDDDDEDEDEEGARDRCCCRGDEGAADLGSREV